MILAESSKILKQKKMYILGEGTTIPSFYADIKSMKKWEEPYEDLKVTESDKIAKIDYVKIESRINGIEVFFE
jgi:hypothetical protein